MMFIPPGATEPAIFDNAIQISAGDNHTTVLDDKGDIYVSGMYKDMDSGKWRDLKTPTDTDIKGNHPYLHKVLGLPKITIMEAGYSWNAALDVDQSTLYTWGMGNSGQLARSSSM
jgi:alpha-tubulin suppressor-like RCC1 family protein